MRAFFPRRKLTLASLYGLAAFAAACTESAAQQGQAASSPSADAPAASDARCVSSLEAGAAASFPEGAQLSLPAALAAGSASTLARLDLATPQGAFSCSYEGKFLSCVRGSATDCAIGDCTRLALKPGDRLDVLSAGLDGAAGQRIAFDDPCAPVAPAAAELCTGGADEDEDGLSDCADPDCIADDACRNAPPEGAVVTPISLTAQARVLEGHAADIRVLEGAINFQVTESTPDIEVGSVIGGALEGGYLRRVTEVIVLPGGRLELRTEAAALEDFWATGAFAVNADEEAWGEVDEAEVPSDLAPMLRPRVRSGLDFDCGAVAPEVSLAPQFDFGPSFDFDMDVQSGALAAASMRAGVQMNAGVRLSGRLEGGLSCSLARDLRGWRATKTFWVPTPSGVIVPVVVVFSVTPQIVLSVEATANGGEISAQLGGSMQAHGEAGFDGAEWSSDADAPGDGLIDFSYTPPEEAGEAVASVELAGRMHFEFGADLYGIVGPRAGIAGRLSGVVESQPDCAWRGHVDIGADLSLGFNLLGYNFGPAFFPIANREVADSNGELTPELCIVCPSDYPIYDRELEKCRAEEVCVEVSSTASCVTYASQSTSAFCMSGWGAGNPVHNSYSIGQWAALPELTQEADSFYQLCSSGNCDWPEDHCFVDKDARGWVPGHHTPAIWSGIATDGAPKVYERYESQTRAATNHGYAPGTLAGYRNSGSYGSGVTFNYCGAGGTSPITTTLERTYWCRTIDP